MRLQNFVIDVQNITPSTGDTAIKVDSTDPGTRAIQNDVYPWVAGRGDINNNPMQLFQGTSQRAGSSFVSSLISGSISQDNTINVNKTMKMTGSLAAPVESASTYKWSVLMVANSIYAG
jgi:hypothetical protein